jgi:hypothetical protein
VQTIQHEAMTRPAAVSLYIPMRPQDPPILIARVNGVYEVHLFNADTGAYLRQVECHAAHGPQAACIHGPNPNVVLVIGGAPLQINEVSLV